MDKTTLAINYYYHMLKERALNAFKNSWFSSKKQKLLKRISEKGPQIVKMNKPRAPLSIDLNVIDFSEVPDWLMNNDIDN
jgi:hypothetical protein